MKFKSPSSLQGWLFSVGAVLLLLMALLSALASIFAGHEQARTQSGTNLGVAAIWLTFDMPIWILEFAGFSCQILAALVSIFRTILPSKLK
jgi:hypothetical protein